MRSERDASPCPGRLKLMLLFMVTASTQPGVEDGWPYRLFSEFRSHLIHAEGFTSGRGSAIVYS